MSIMEPQMKAGWYPDPWNPASQRWWDGTQWGWQTWDFPPRPLTPPAAPVPIRLRNYAASATLTSGIATFVAGLIPGTFFSFVAILGIIAVAVWSSFAIANVKRGRPGKGRIIAGMILAGIVLIGVVAVIVQAFA